MEPGLKKKLFLRIKILSAQKTKMYGIDLIKVCNFLHNLSERLKKLSKYRYFPKNTVKIR